MVKISKDEAEQMGADVDSDISSDDCPDAFRFRIDARPVGKQRARVTEGGTYIPEKTRDFESKVEWQANKAAPDDWPLDEQYAVSYEAVYPDARTADVDNICKALLDGMQGTAFDDDTDVRQIDGQLWVDRDESEGYVEVKVEVME